VPAADLMEAGEQRSLVERLYKELGSRLEAFLYRLTGSHADAIELAQETYLRMLQIKDMDAIRSPKAYMFRVAANLAAEEATRQGRARATLDISDAAIEAELSHDPGFADQIDAAELAARRDAALAELPARCRAAYWFAHSHDMSYEEIARQVGVSKETVKKDLSRAIRHLRERLERP
jgi:RNA polymerase sigma-70 factor (ECF subfamily)